MKLSRVKVLTNLFFCALILTFSYQFFIFAQPPELNVPAELSDLLTGKTSDFNSAASQLKETDLPAAISVVELLKFKALHQEIPANIDQINIFESLIKARLEKSSVVSFFKTDTCLTKVEEKEVEIAGQKLIIPEFFISETGLAITAVTPTGEAGTIFPDIRVNVFSQSALSEYLLSIDEKPISKEVIDLFKDDNELTLVLRPELTDDSLLSIGTHTVKISINNDKGEQTTKQWTFTVGVHDIPTPPMPDGCEIIAELPIKSDKLLPGREIDGNLSVIVYQDKTGRRYTEYKLVTLSGTIFKTRNLAYIARKISQIRNRSEKLTILPKLFYAFIGNQINFSYEWSGGGKVIGTEWLVTSGQETSTSPSIKISGRGTEASCLLTIEYTFIDENGNEQTYQTEVSAARIISGLIITTSISPGRDFQISNQLPCKFPISGFADASIMGNLVEGAEYTFNNGDSQEGNPSTLKVNRLRWKILNSEGASTVEEPVASQTNLIFTENGFAEVVFDIDLTWNEGGLSLNSNYKPENSGLFAFFPVKGKGELAKIHPGLIMGGSRFLNLKKLEFEVNGQSRQIESESDWQLKQPILLCKSILDPASFPIIIENALPLIRTGHYPSGLFLHKKGVLTFILEHNLPLSSPPQSSPLQLPLSLYCQFHKTDNAEDIYTNQAKATLVNDFPTLPCYYVADALSLNFKPSNDLVIQEGQKVDLSAEIVPADSNLGTGIYSKEEQTLNILDGYEVSKVSTIYWRDEFLPKEEISKLLEKAEPTLDFTHTFEPDSGIGSYAVLCLASLVIEESETKDRISALPYSIASISVNPGLRIFSPIPGLCYPLNQTIKVTTNMDSEEFKDQWQAIKWKLNDEEFDPPGDEPGFPLLLDRTGQWSIEARLETLDPVTGRTIPLVSKVDFEVKPLGIAISPVKKVAKFTPSIKLPIELIVTANGNNVERPGKEFYWNDKTPAIIDPVKWSLVSDPKECAACEFDSQSFKTDCMFSAPGASTILATVTLRITGAEALFKKAHKGFNDKFEEQIFEFPVTRADLWTVEPPVWFNTTGKTARRAIQNTNRLFSLVSGQIQFYGHEYGWDNNSDFADKIKIPAAIPNIRPLTSVGVKFAWSGPDEQSSETPEFKPDFKNIGSQEVVMGSSIEFDSGDSINFENDKTDVKVEPLSKVIYVKVMANPSNVGKSQPSQVSLSFGETDGVIDSQTQLDIWNGEYNLKLTKVAWSCSGGVLTPTDDNGANAKFSSSDAGQFKISGTPNFSVKPLDCDEVDMALNPSETSVNVLGELIAWKVDKDRSDHLDRIRYAASPYDDIYKETLHQIWSSEGVRPLVVGCSSEVSLIPVFSSTRPNSQLEVFYRWIHDSGNVGLEGTVPLKENILIPTPKTINKYQLSLQIQNFSAPNLIPEVYAVKKIIDESEIATGTVKKVYFMRCIKDSVQALKNNSPTISDKLLLDIFFRWWWTDENKLSYGRGTSHSNTSQVAIHGYAFCQGLANYYYKCLECQGIEGLQRIFIHLQAVANPYSSVQKNLPIPNSPEYWGAIVVTNFGLNNIDKLFTVTLPNNYPVAYRSNAIREYTGQKKIPPPNTELPNGTQTIILNLDENVTKFPETEAYVFRSPDGHAVVLFTDKASRKTYLCDPSFDNFDKPFEINDIPEDGMVIIKEITEEDIYPRYKALADYLDRTVAFFRGFTYFKSNEFESGMSVFDFHISQLNFLKVEFENFTSEEEQQDE